MSSPGIDRLSWGDALFLYLERDGMPMHVASVFVFEGDLSGEDCLAAVEAKLPLLPRYRQRLSTPPLNVAFPTWECDPEFDLRNHVREVTLKRGTETELKALAGSIFSVCLDRRRPMWDITIVRGLNGDRSAMIARLHHSLADGIAGIGMMNVLMDPTPIARISRRSRRRPKQAAYQAPPPRDPGMLLIDGLIGAYGNLVQRALVAQAEVLNLTVRMVADGPAAMTDLVRLIPELAAPAEPLPFNAICRGPQKFAWAQIPLADLKAVKNALGATVNDVALALVTSAMQRYSGLHGANLTGRTLRMMMPVNVRPNGDGGLGNNISLVPVTVPLDISDLRQLVTRVHEKTEFLKKAHIAEFVRLAGTLAGTAPAPLQAAVLPILTQLPLTVWNMVCTNVRGPEMPLYLFGHRLLNWYPYVPIGGDMAVNCAILTYDGVAYFGFSGDVHGAPDLPRLEEFLAAAFRELRKAAGLQAPHRRRSRPKKPRAATGSTFSEVPVSGRAAVPASEPAQEKVEKGAKPLAAAAVA